LPGIEQTIKEGGTRKELSFIVETYTDKLSAVHALSSRSIMFYPFYFIAFESHEPVQEI